MAYAFRAVRRRIPVFVPLVRRFAYALRAVRRLCPVFVPFLRRVAAALFAERLRAFAFFRRVAAALLAAADRRVLDVLTRRVLLRLVVFRFVGLRRLRGLINRAPVVGMAMGSLQDKRREAVGKKNLGVRRDRKNPPRDPSKIDPLGVVSATLHRYKVSRLLSVQSTRMRFLVPLPPKLPRGKASHKLEVRVPRYLWHEFLDACKAAGNHNASNAIRESMRVFIRSVRKREIVLGPKGSKQSRKK